jgi:hypothetical protein
VKARLIPRLIPKLIPKRPDPMTEQREYKFGNPQQQQSFGERHRRFFEGPSDNLRALISATFNRSWSTSQPIDRFIYQMGFLAADDFMEILLVCGNGEGYAAQKILRPMFERVVLLKYLTQHPDELDLFIDYYWIGHRKLMRQVEDTFNPGILDPAKVQEVSEQVRRIKEKYQVTDCETCGTTRLNHTWTPKDMVTMAKQAGMESHIVPDYIIPLRYAHATVNGLFERIELKDNQFTMRDRIQPQMADLVFCSAHSLLLKAIAIQVHHFKLDARLFRQSELDFMAVWKRDDVTPPPIPQNWKSRAG